jgi:hypothetical protein
MKVFIYHHPSQIDNVFFEKDSYQHQCKSLADRIHNSLSPLIAFLCSCVDVEIQFQIPSIRTMDNLSFHQRKVKKVLRPQSPKEKIS